MFWFSADAVYLCSHFPSLLLTALCWCLSIGLLCPLSGRLLCVCVCVGVCLCVCVVLLQEADSREVCLNRQGVQRPCSYCTDTGPWHHVSITMSASRIFTIVFLFAILLLLYSFVRVSVGTHTRIHVCAWAPGQCTLSCLFTVNSTLLLHSWDACYSAISLLSGAVKNPFSASIWNSHTFIIVSVTLCKLTT